MTEKFDIFDIRLTPKEIVEITTRDMRTSSFSDHRDPAVVKQLGGANRTP